MWLFKRWTQRHAQANDSFSGQGHGRSTVQRENGNVDCSDSLNSRRFLRAIRHRFRDTFAVELLLAGVPLDRVSIFLSYSSIRITERHYAP